MSTSDSASSQRTSSLVSILVVVDWSRQRPVSRNRAGRDQQFQSLLQWIGRVNSASPRLRVRSLDGFQSLLWRIGRVNPIPGTWNFLHRGPVSILVVVDWTRQRGLVTRRRGGAKKSSHPPLRVSASPREPWPIIRTGKSNFNPCCGGLVASTLAHLLGIAADLPVSILVVVDWSRQLSCQRIARGRAHGVSILVVVDWSRQRRYRAQPRRIDVPFQSLLWWIGRVNTSFAGSKTTSLAKFQSLLWWIGRVNDLRKTFPRSTATCFNPCCGGLVASTSSDHLGQRGAQCFNPCCGGLVASTATRGRGGARHARLFQSLLWWIGRVNSTMWPSRPRRTSGFNPCCGGLVASTPMSLATGRVSIRVSILVVVDWSRQRSSSAAR